MDPIHNYENSQIKLYVEEILFGGPKIKLKMPNMAKRKSDHECE